MRQLLLTLCAEINQVLAAQCGHGAMSSAKLQLVLTVEQRLLMCSACQSLMRLAASYVPASGAFTCPATSTRAHLRLPHYQKLQAK